MNKKKAYVVGTNASTSLSPAIFNYWFEKYSINATYGYKEIKEENFNEEIKIILKEKGLVGLNITMPYKEKIIPHLTNYFHKNKNGDFINFHHYESCSS